MNKYTFLKVLLFLLLTLFFLSSNPYTREPSNNWIIIQDLKDRIVYIDSTSVEYAGDEFKVWSLTIYRIPVNMTSLSEKVARVKSHLWIDARETRYYLIESFYYNENGNIVGQAVPNDAILDYSLYSLPLEENTATYSILEKCLEIKRMNLYASGRKEKEPVSEQRKIEENIQTPEKEPVTETTESASPIPVIETPIVKENDSVKKEQTPEYEYKLEREKAVSNTVFTDGKLYCIQHSSWRTEEKAKSVAEQLKSKGHNAYVIDAFFPESKKTWYRVRVGFFDTLQEAKAYQKKLK